MIEGQLDDTLVALSDGTRRAILDRLSRGEARVTEVAQPFAISLNSVSKHIRILERAGLVQAAGRIYAGGVLRFGGRVRLREAWRGAEA